MQLSNSFVNDKIDNISYNFLESFNYFLKFNFNFFVSKIFQYYISCSIYRQNMYRYLIVINLHIKHITENKPTILLTLNNISIED